MRIGAFQFASGCDIAENFEKMRTAVFSASAAPGWVGSTLPMPGVGVGRGATAMGDAFGGRAAEDWRRLWARFRRRG